MDRVTTTEQLAEALQRARPDLAGAEGGARGWAREAERELRRWGHDGHVVTLERVSPVAGQAGAVGCLFWCESCHVSQLMVLSQPAAG